MARRAAFPLARSAAKREGGAALRASDVAAPPRLRRFRCGGSVFSLQSVPVLPAQRSEHVSEVTRRATGVSLLLP